MVQFFLPFMGPCAVLCVLLASSFSIVSGQEDAVLVKDKKIKLNSGDWMPLIGFGTWKIQDSELVKISLDFALAAGYRHIDTAALYKNEKEIGIALKELLPKHNLTRKDIFITTKLIPTEYRGEKTYSALEESLRNLDCEYLDLYLIHWPGVYGKNLTNEEIAKLRDQRWQQLVEAKKNGLTRNIGVSNYNIFHLTELLNNTHGVKPAVNQVEWHPRYHPDDLLNFCRNEGILLEAYSSLGGTAHEDLRNDPEVKKIAEKLGKSPAQVLLRWAVQQDIAIIPKSRTKKYIEENIDLNFVIPEADMKMLSGFEEKKYFWNPDTVA